MDQSEETGSLKEELLIRIDRRDNKLAIASSIVDAVKKGDKTALNLVASLLEEKSKAADELFPINDAKLEEIICLCADRIRGARTF